MEFVTDLHLHSRYSRAVSQNMILSTMAQYASQKGLDILTASDWAHPLWFKEIRAQLKESSEGLYSLTTGTDEMKKILFLLSVEISSIYKQGEKLRRIHNLVFAPNFEVAEKINEELRKRGCNLSSDGRPIVGLSSKALLELILSIDERCMLIPAHIWTPHFGIYGSASGFDSLDEAFGELSQYIYGIETGLSSDPDMNWQVQELMDRSILSFSDAHSPAKMGREATVLMSKQVASSQKLEAISYEDIRQSIMRKSDKWRIGYTLEFYPEEGKYHFSGHRNCKVSVGPDEIRAGKTICPVCNKKLTEGVLYRVQQLANSNFAARAKEKKNVQNLKWYTDTMHKQPPYVKLVPLLEIIAEATGSTVASQRVQATFASLCHEFGSEIEVLLRTPIEDIKKKEGEKLAESIARVRSGNVTLIPGYDGEYGKVEILKEEPREITSPTEEQPQLSLEL